MTAPNTTTTDAPTDQRIARTRPKGAAKTTKTTAAASTGTRTRAQPTATTTTRTTRTRSSTTGPARVEGAEARITRAPRPPRAAPAPTKALATEPVATTDEAVATAPSASPPGVPMSKAMVWAAAILLAGAGVIHFAFARPHLSEYLPFGIAFYAMAGLQLGGGLALVWRTDHRRLLAGAVAVNLGICALWLVTRTIGLPVGNEVWKPEAVTFADSVCVGFQLLASVLLVAASGLTSRLAGLGARRVGVYRLVAALAVVTIAVVPLTAHGSQVKEHNGPDTAPMGMKG